MTSRKQRIPFRDFSTLSAEDREMGERNKVNGEVVNIFRVLMNNPKLARSWSRFAGYILGGQSLPARDREILILRIGWLNQAAYEWEQHVRIGKAAGLTDDEIDRISKGPKAGWDKHEAALVQAADDLREKSVVSEETWKQLSERLQHRTDDGCGFHSRAVQPGLVGAQQFRRAARRLPARREQARRIAIEDRWCEKWIFNSRKKRR